MFLFLIQPYWASECFIFWELWINYVWPLILHAQIKCFIRQLRQPVIPILASKFWQPPLALVSLTPAPGNAEGMSLCDPGCLTGHKFHYFYLHEYVFT